MELFTIGFTQKTAERFFGLLLDNQVSTLVDTRLNPDGQLSGFARRVDLPYLCRELAGCDYVHVPELAPTKELMTEYRDGNDWERYVGRYAALLDDREIPGSLDPPFFTGQRCCLLCSEHPPDRCHRRLLAERLATAWPELTIVHLT